MAITYPYPVSFLADRLNIESVMWDIKRNDELSGSGDGRVWQAELAPPLWTADVKLNIGRNASLKQIAALIRKLQGAQEQFFLFDPLSKFPQAYPDGNFFPGESFANMLGNPGFESATLPPWFTGAGISTGTGTGHGGSKYLVMDKGAAGAGAGTQRETLQVVDGIQAGKRYQYSAWLNSGVAASSTAGAYLSLQWRDAANSVISTSQVIVNAGYGPVWSQISGVATAPALATRVLPYIVFGISSTLQTLIVDDVSLTRYETFTGSAQVNSIGAGGRTVSLKGLPAGYKLTLADKLQIAYATSPVRNAFLEIDENIVADSSGITSQFEVFPNAPTGVAINDVVTLAKPACKVFIAPGSHNPGLAAGLMTSGASFKVIEKR